MWYSPIQGTCIKHALQSPANVETVCGTTCAERLSQLTASLKREQHVLKKAGLGSGSVGGGTFEWVDSLLVKALRKGHWLLIDNVNFCRYVWLFHCVDLARMGMLSFVVCSIIVSLF